MGFQFQGKDDPERKTFYAYTKAHTAGKSTEASQSPSGEAVKRGGGIAAGCFLVVLAFLVCIGTVNALLGDDEEPTRAVQVPNTPATASPSRVAPSVGLTRSPSHTRTTESPLPTYSPPPPPPPRAVMATTSIRDPRGDAEAGPAGGAAPGYVDLIRVTVAPAGSASAAVIFTAAGRIPSSVPLYDEINEINYGAFLKQGSQEIFLSISSRVELGGRWKVVVINMFGAFKADRVRLNISPAIQGSRLAIEIPIVLKAGGATVDLRQPIALSAESGAVIYPGGWTDQA